MSLYRLEPLGTPVLGPGRRSPFVTSFTTTRELLARELRALGATDVRLQIDVLPGMIRLDGELKSGARVDRPACRLVFDTANQGRLAYGTAEFSTWQDNLRGIALALEALRKVDRDGVARGAQYAGYRELGPGTGARAMGGLTRDQALALLEQVDYGDPSLDGTQMADLDRSLWPTRRSLRAKAHPDINGGDQTLWDRVEAACDLLGIEA